MSPTKVIFPGQPPHQLEVTQSASADATGDVVTMTLYVLAEGQGDAPIPLTTIMTFGTASALGHQLVKAAVLAESAKK